MTAKENIRRKQQWRSFHIDPGIPRFPGLRSHGDGSQRRHDNASDGEFTVDLGQGWSSVWRLPPAVPEAGVVFDLVAGRVEVAKLVSDTLDRGPHIRPITIGAASGDEALIVQPVVDRAVGYVPTQV